MKQSFFNNYVRTCLGLCLLLFGVSIGTAMADSVIVDGVEYTTNSNDYTAKAMDLPVNLSIPSVISYDGDEYSMDRIDRNTFKDCSSLTSVTILENVTSIGGWWLGFLLLNFLIILDMTIRILLIKK